MKYNLFPYLFVASPKMCNKHDLVPLSSYEDMYEINILFHDGMSYFDLKLHNMFLRCLFMTQFKN